MKYLHRAIIVGNEVVGGYSIAAEEDNIHLRQQTYENREEFIKSIDDKIKGDDNQTIKLTDAQKTKILNLLGQHPYKLLD